MVKVYCIEDEVKVHCCHYKRNASYGYHRLELLCVNRRMYNTAILRVSDAKSVSRGNILVDNDLVSQPHVYKIIQTNVESTDIGDDGV